MTPQQKVQVLEMECARFETDEREWESRYAVHVDRMHRILYGVGQ